MSMPLFKSTLRSNWVILLIFLLILCLYMGSFISMYSPDSTQSMQEMLKMLPEELVRAMGIGEMSADLTSYLANYFYGMLIFLIPLIYVAIVANRLVARQVDSGFMAYLLSTPNKRIKIAITQGVWFLLSIAALFVLLTGVTILLCQAAYPGQLDAAAFIRLNVCTFLLTAAVGALSWFFSCVCNDVKYSLTFGAGIPVLLFMMNLFGGIRENLGWLGALSPYGLFKAGDIIRGSADMAGICLSFILSTLVLYAAGILIFSRKNLPL
jgi:ABC-2 type transport system permease protein